MRLGVSGKILVAYMAMALVFVASSVLTLVYMHRARSRVVASQLLFDVQMAVDASWRALDEFTTTSGNTRRPDPRRAHALVLAQRQLEAGLDAIDGYLEEAPVFPDPPDVPMFRRQLAELGLRVAQAASGLGPYEASRDPEATLAFEGKLATLIARLDRVKREVRSESARIAAQLRHDEEKARTLALAVATFGLVVAVVVALSMMRTLRPLRVLRQRAREVAGGNYDQRVAVDSRDEIGELAREFDAMAVAVKEREQRLIQSERLATVGQMAAHITHEIRNPLSSIGLNVELLGDEFGAHAGEARKLVTAIAAEVDRLSDISETYLKFVRIPRADRQHEDLGAIVTSVLEFARADLQRAGVESKVEVERDVPEILADEGQIRQAVLNLVRNAREAMAEGGRLEVRVYRDVEGNACVRVRDTGPGVDPENVDRIFAPFFSTKRKGTGLGLLLVQQVLADHGGRVAVSNVEGGGTAFELVFPPITPAEGGGEGPDDDGRRDGTAPATSGDRSVTGDDRSRPEARDLAAARVLPATEPGSS